MRTALRLLAAPMAALSLFLAASPLLAAILLGADGLPRLAFAPDWAAACVRSLMLAEATMLVGWPVGAAAAFALWGAPAILRRCVLGAAILCLLLPPSWSAHGLLLAADRLAHPGAHLAALILGHAAQAASVVTLVLTAALNRLDPQILRAAAACGARPDQAWRLAAAPLLTWPLLVSLASSCIVALAQPALDALLETGTHVSLDSLVLHGGSAAGCLMLAVLSASPLVVLGFARLLRRQAVLF